MVQLGVLADGLAGCAKCGIPLHLTHTVDILHCGLGALLRVMCHNTTGKRHGRIWNANTKLVAGIIMPPVLIFILFVG